MTPKPDKNTLNSIASNADRLLSDANILLGTGSFGSAMSLAILAFEEIGKGQSLELGAKKTKSVPSWHQFRQANVCIVLMLSLFQKYEIQMPELSDETRKNLEKSRESIKTQKELANTPITDELRKQVLTDAPNLFNGLDRERFQIFSVELRWVKKLMMEALQGEIEKQRQRGMYIDLKDGVVSSNPADVCSNEAYYWIRATERALRIFRFGEFAQPYGELAELLETVPSPLPPLEDIFKVIDELQNSGE